jgi:hypothetical protein
MMLVYYDDDYPDSGGIGIEICDDERKAKEYIRKRLAGRTIPAAEIGEHYRVFAVIEEMKIKPTAVATDIDLIRR